tara:strand:- start:2418 stop:2660 length:243 start_codon:yes stop_codon:yes gene_type:complete
MIKTLFASASTFAYIGCIAVCCMGNDYPAKADCAYRTEGAQSYSQCLNDRRDAENETRRQLEEQRQRIDDEIRFGTYRPY